VDGTQQSNLPAYEEIIDSLAGKLGSLSTIHQGLAEAAESILEAKRELAESRRQMDDIARRMQRTLEEMQQLQAADPAKRLDDSLTSFDRNNIQAIRALRSELSKFQYSVDASHISISGRCEDIERRQTAFAERLEQVYRQVIDLKRGQDSLLKS